MAAIIEYAYSSQIRLSPLTIQPLLHAASVLQIDNLEFACCQYIKDKILAHNNCLGKRCSGALLPLSDWHFQDALSLACHINSTNAKYENAVYNHDDSLLLRHASIITFGVAVLKGNLSAMLSHPAYVMLLFSHLVTLRWRVTSAKYYEEALAIINHAKHPVSVCSLKDRQRENMSWTRHGKQK